MKEKLELVLDEASEGHFYWSIIRRSESGAPPVVIDFSSGPMPTRISARARGCAAMRCHQEAATLPTPPFSSMCGDQFPDTVPTELA